MGRGLDFVPMLELRRLNAGAPDFWRNLVSLAWYRGAEAKEVEQQVAAILGEVRDFGDEALLEFTRRFDRSRVRKMATLTADAAALEAAYGRLPAADRAALDAAAERIRTFHERQLRATTAFEYEDAFGNRLGHRLTPLHRVGVYVPGGQASYPSTALMTVIPARVAGVAEVVVTTPRRPGTRNDHVLAALHVAGADMAFAVGGAQAIAALAYGTETVPEVNKIVGPGGGRVAEAKRQVFGLVGIDNVAGPSEIFIVADGSAPPRWAALDLFAQAEHDAAAQALLACPDAAWLDAVAAEAAALLPTMPRRKIIAASLAEHGALIETQDLEQAMEVANFMAPEHLHLAVADPDALLPSARDAGAIFLGAAAAETFGDYNAGPSHVLPTYRTSRYASPLGVEDFLKRSSIIRITPAGAAELAPNAAAIATAEGLHAHAAAALARRG